MKVMIVVPPKVGNEWVHREDKHVAFHDYPMTPYTLPVIHSLIINKFSNFEIELLECQRDGLDIDQAMSELDRFEPDLIVCLMTWLSIPWDRKLAETKYKTIGLIFQQWVSQKAAINQYKLTVDCIVKSELELPLLNAIEEFYESGSIINTKGVLVRNSNGDYIDTGIGDKISMDDMPMPSFDIMDYEKYFEERRQSGNFTEDRVRLFSLNTQKGCVFTCSFCGQANSPGKKTRVMSGKKVADQVEYLHKNYQIKNFEFIDNIFCIDKKRAKAFCCELIERDLNISFSIQDRMGYYDDELLTLLKKAGCREIRIGIETIDPKLQGFLNKELNVRVYKKWIKKIVDMGIDVYLYMTPGIPGENLKSLWMNAKFVVDVRATKYSAGPLFIMPSSPLYDRLNSQGKILEKDWSFYRKFTKITYVNETYPSLRDLDRAIVVFKRMVFIYRLIKTFEVRRNELRWFLGERVLNIIRLFRKPVKKIL